MGSIAPGAAANADTHVRFIACVGACLPVAAVAWLHFVHDVPVPKMTRDVAVIGGVHPLAGFLSNLGILGWSASAAVWVFSAFVLRERGAHAQATFAFAFGLLSCFLTFDDLFQFHESLAPRYLGLGERTVYALLAAAILSSLVFFRKLLLSSRIGLLAVSFVLLGSSVSIDVLSPWIGRMGHWHYLLEDGLKWLGIAAWAAFCFSWCKEALLSVSGRYQAIP